MKLVENKKILPGSIFNLKSKKTIEEYAGLIKGARKEKLMLEWKALRNLG